MLVAPFRVLERARHTPRICMPINSSLIVCLSLALLLVVVALAREIRLRRALQMLLARILALWRSQFEAYEPTELPPKDADPDRARSRKQRLP